MTAVGEDVCGIDDCLICPKFEVFPPSTAYRPHTLNDDCWCGCFGLGEKRQRKGLPACMVAETVPHADLPGGDRGLYWAGITVSLS